SAELRKKSFPLDEKTKNTKYPIRALRYWWVLSAINEELEKLDSPPTIADIGCDRALFKRLLPDIEGGKVIGLDLGKSLEINKEDLDLAGYDEVKPCNLDEGIPLPDASIDIAINLHVMEHLPRPEFSISEIARVLRPGGLLLLGFPVLPKPFAHIREKQFAKQFAEGARILGQHQHAFWPSRARKLVEDAGLEVEFMIGTYFIRKRGAFWENSAVWMRVNQLWGAMFPSLSQELCIKVRKPS
ncbi:MAG: methyltransferase domain-containing protein, partial [Desulfobulbaceae bacterium]|nr:methyltransferase domain-containing protein [Desulfobulbaceae bacterium]